ncbi:uncharacterized protein LOC128550077 isoform X2 [Mercenaria mercenaria]|uniref:uncharacterized protein LOC128550077 isoform X2 n=1 Tax=Mercenaria mercenaria TaxID=6596 RepID=UPI00234EC485|nr:uncharacterized protein LOC128550077 isoform X2 [Mercenaria mercenaria]
MVMSRWTGAGLLLALQMSHVAAYPGGAPQTACDDMTPRHGFDAQNDTTSMYDIKPSARTYCPKNEVKITLEGAPYGVTFKGFLCQARTSVNTATTIGSLTPADSKVATNNFCVGKASLTHSDGLIKKKEVHLTWTPDISKTDSVYIVCTIVKEKSIFWVNQSIEIAYAGTDKCTSEGEVKGLPTSCTDSQTCEMAVSMAECDTVAGKCVCPSDMKIAHPTHTYCSPKKLGDSCASDSDCMAVAETVCDTTNVCACKSAFTSNTTDNCFLKVLGDVCSSHDDCRGIPKSVCNGTCKCPPEYKHQRNQTHTNCVLRGTNVCTSNTDCTGTEGNQCVEGKCTSGVMKTTVVSLILLFGGALLSRQISIL